MLTKVQRPGPNKPSWPFQTTSLGTCLSWIYKTLVFYSVEVKQSYSTLFIRNNCYFYQNHHKYRCRVCLQLV